MARLLDCDCSPPSPAFPAWASHGSPSCPLLIALRGSPPAHAGLCILVLCCLCTPCPLARPGARVIYETDDDNELIGDRTVDDYFLTDPRVALFGAGQSGGIALRQATPDMADCTSSDKVPGACAVNPYAFFGQPSVWPRGYPLNKIGSWPAIHSTQSGVAVFPAVQQGLANGDPDVDAIFRLTRKRTDLPIQITFTDSEPVAIAPFVFTPFNSQNTLFHYSALWGLMIPRTTTFRVCDIWRGYWAQRLLWELPAQLSFHPPSVRQIRNPHDYILDYLDERDLYEARQHSHS